MTRLRGVAAAKGREWPVASRERPVAMIANIGIDRS